MSYFSSFANSFFKDSDGKVVLAQKPNLAIIVWLVAIVVTKLTNSEVLQQIASIVSFGAIIIWAGLELFLGVNYFRRLLGLVILVVSIYSRVS